MHKIDTETASSANEFTDGDSSGIVPATELNASWFNSVQREICNAVEKTGQTLDSQNDEQLFNAISIMGLKVFYTDGDFTVSDSFKGAAVLFCTAKDFEIVGNLRSDSILIVIPMWSTSSSGEITLDYSSWSYKIQAGFGFFAFADNGFEHDTGLYGIQFPISANGKVLKSSRVIADNVVAGTVKADGYIDSIVEFEYREDESGLQQWQKFQLANNWQVGQSKKVICTNAGSSGTDVIMYKNNSGTWHNVRFYPNSFREFVYTGVTYAIGGYVYAVLNVDGKPIY